MAFRNLPTSLTIPSDAGPGDSRIVIGGDIPEPLASYEFTDRFDATGTAIAAILFHSNDTDYGYIALVVADNFLLVEGAVVDGVMAEAVTGTPNGSVWDFTSSGVFAQYRLHADSFEVKRALANVAFDHLQIGAIEDSSSRFTIAGTGQLDWGGGSADQDTNLYRDSADVLKTDDSLTVGQTLTAGNIRSGTVTITPLATNVAASATVSYAAMSGSNFSAQGTPHTSVPQSVDVGVSGISSTGLTVTLTRSDVAIATTVSWFVIGD